MKAKPPTDRPERFGMRLPPSLLGEVRALAERRSTTVTAIFTEAVRVYLDQCRREEDAESL